MCDVGRELDGPIETAAAAAVNVVVLAFLLLGTAAFHRDVPLPGGGRG